ncbi:MAG: hypothetical protein LBE12_12000 [Planctomycetaceae bacterium]|jgi:transposase|nr:hypothetical protein [Planctomycetaceae bacterium]
MNRTIQPVPSVIGINISKETLDVYYLPSREYKKVENNKAGLKELLA